MPSRLLECNPREERERERDSARAHPSQKSDFLKQTRDDDVTGSQGGARTVVVVGVAAAAEVLEEGEEEEGDCP